uniref:Uncharacterized protein n=1 Tax=Mycena chlorophos TaxID=658473 RepID=A0ABQ0KXY0_MYCCL|nr:predicted protein [Mycena chlorophos]
MAPMQRCWRSRTRCWRNTMLPKRVTTGRSQVKVAQPWTDDRPEPMEILARLAGNTSFRLPSSGGRASVTNEDVAHALGCVQDRLAQMLALAIATGSTKEWPSIQRLAAPRLLSQLQADRRTRSLVAGFNRYRARLVLHDAFHDLVCGRTLSWREAARLCRMAQQPYRDLHGAVTGFLQTEAVAAAHAAARALFGQGH